jgi:hypothetical protein
MDVVGCEWHQTGGTSRVVISSDIENDCEPPLHWSISGFSAHPFRQIAVHPQCLVGCCQLSFQSTTCTGANPIHDYPTLTGFQISNTEDQHYLLICRFIHSYIFSIVILKGCYIGVVNMKVFSRKENNWQSQTFQSTNWKLYKARDVHCICGIKIRPEPFFFAE